jgi:hypothetical protein
MLKSKLIILSVFLALSIISKANPSFNGQDFSDSSNITSYRDKLGLYVYSIRKFRAYDLKNADLGLKLKFEPNGQTNIGLGFTYKWIVLGLGFSAPFVNKDNDIYGETKRYDIQLNLFSRYFGVSAYYQNYQGFYLSNPQDFVNWNKPYFPKLDDIKCISEGISLFYWFNNKNFSYKAAYVRNEFQKKSAGGFILGAYADFDNVDAPNGFIPEDLPDTLTNIFDFRNYSTSVFGVSFGYAYTLVFLKRFFINLSAVPGIGYRNLSVDYNIKNDNVLHDFTGTIKGRFSFGYEGKHFYFGSSAIAGMESFKYEEVDISTRTGQFRIYFGKRFNVGKKSKNNSR